MARWSAEGIGWPWRDQGGMARGVWVMDRPGWVGWLEWSGPRIDRGGGGGGGVVRGVWAKDGPGVWLEGSGPWMDPGGVARVVVGHGWTRGVWLEGSKPWMDQGCVARGPGVCG